MSQDLTLPHAGPTGEFIVPGTCFGHASPAPQECVAEPGRDRVLRHLYLKTAMADVPRLLGSIDRNPYRPTYGCLDRQFWHYRTSPFPSEMYQEGALPLALVYTTNLPGNRWQGNGRIRELAVAAIRFAARSCHRDASCDDYYPFERALGAAVFSLQAAARAYQILELDDAELAGWLQRRARWIIAHDESGRLSNHHALAALGLLRVAEITGDRVYRDAADARVRQVLDWQSDEGWFEEYGGADPGYQTVTIDCLAKIRRATASLAAGGTADATLDEPLRRAVAFARCFLHPDNSYGGEYGSRGTYHFYPHGMELLAADNANAAELADGFLQSLAVERHASFSDDRLFIHRMANLIEAHIDWSPARPAASEPPQCELTQCESTHVFSKAGLLVRRTGTDQTVISTARGGVFKHLTPAGAAVTDAGLIVETTDGRVAVSQMHQPGRSVHVASVPRCRRHDQKNPAEGTLSIGGSLCWARFETATPLKQAVFHAGMATVGRWCRNRVRRILQRRLITGRRACPVRLTRMFEFLSSSPDGPRLRVTDTIELTDARLHVARMAFGSDHESVYVATSGVYQDAVLAPWTDLGRHVDELNAERHVTVVREW